MPVDFDTDSSICFCPESLFDIHFKREELLRYDARIFDVQGIKIPIKGVINIKVDGITTIFGTNIEIPLNVVVPFAVIGSGDSLILSAKFMSSKYLNILRFMERLYRDCVRNNDEGILCVDVIAESTLTDAEWNLCSKWHNDTEGHAKNERFQRIIRNKEGVVVSLTKLRQFVRYCSHCQKDSLGWLVSNHVVIDNSLLNCVMIDIYYAGDIDPLTRKQKYWWLTICDCTSRTAQAIKLTGLKAAAIVLALVKGAVLFPFTKAYFMSDRGTHFFRECNELLGHLVGKKYTMNPAASHQSQATLERVHEEINRHLRPLLNQLWKANRQMVNTEEMMEAGVALAFGIYNRMPHEALGFHSPQEVFCPMAEQSIRVFNELNDPNARFDNRLLEDLFALHADLWDVALTVNEEINKAFIARDVLGPRFPLEVGDLVLVRYDPAPGAGKPQKLNTRNEGPFEIVNIRGDFYDIKTITGFDKRASIHVTRLKPFYWDRRLNRTPKQVAEDAQRTSVVIAINDWGPKNAINNRNMRVQDLHFVVEFVDGVFEVPYDNIKAVDVFEVWLASDDGLEVRRIKTRRVVRAGARKVQSILAPSTSYVKVTWEARPQDSYMVDSEGIGIEDLDFRSKELFDNKLLEAPIISDDPRIVDDMKYLLYKFQDIFSDLKHDDFINVPPVRVEMKSDIDNEGKVTWVKGPPFRNPKTKDSFDRIIHKLKDVQGRIEEIPAGEDCKYNTPVFIRHEPLDKDRMCHNSKHINVLLAMVKFYMGFSVKDIFDSLSGCLCITMLDLQASFYQFLVATEFRNLTAFTDPSTGKRYRLKCLGMGLSNSPAVMQSLMQSLFTGFMVYIDNVCFGTPGPIKEAWPKHKLRIVEAFEICRKYNIKLNLRKCIFNCGKSDYNVDCLGRLTNHEWNSIDDKTRDKIRNMSRPKSTIELGKTLASLNWIRPYVESFGPLASELYKFTSPDYRGMYIYWSDESLPRSQKTLAKTVQINKELWDDLLNACSHPSLIYYIDEAKRLFACSDASKDGWGFIIFQLTREDLSFDDISVDSEGVKLQGRKLIAINSGSFNKEQRIWSTTDQECYAIYRGIMDNKHLLFGRLFSLVTDHKNLTFLVDSESDRVQRYKFALQVFNINWVHAPGAGDTLEAPDRLSRYK